MNREWCDHEFWDAQEVMRFPCCDTLMPVPMIHVAAAMCGKCRKKFSRRDIIDYNQLKDIIMAWCNDSPGETQIVLRYLSRGPM